MTRYIVKDTFFKKAKEKGYRARSAYKLKEIQNRFRLIKKGDRVLDLGCAPGSFLQVLSGLVGEKGTVVGVDLIPVEPLSCKNVITYTCDIRSLPLDKILSGLSLKHFDAITCDISPNLSGIKEVDDKNIHELFLSVKDIIKKSLKTGGNLVLKSFFSENLKEIIRDLKRFFKQVTLFKPAASRSRSSEIYLICICKLTDK